MLTHVDSSNRPSMVDVSDKNASKRKALAQATLRVPKEVLSLLEGEELVSKKGPVFATAIIAGTMAAKRTHDLIPFCHPLMIRGCRIHIQFAPDDIGKILVQCEVTVLDQTGVEMEALVGANIAALTIYDMLKAVSHDIVIESVCLLEKKGGKSGDIETTAPKP